MKCFRSREKTNLSVIVLVFSLIFLKNQSLSTEENEVSVLNYDIYLKRALEAETNKEYAKGLERLDQAIERYPVPDWKYYYIRASILEKMGREDEAIENYKLTIEKNPNETTVFRKLYELHYKIRKILPAFDYLRLYLSKEEDPELRFKATVLSARLGDKKYLSYSVKKIQSKTEKEESKKSISIIKKYLSDKNYKAASDESENAIYRFPLSEEIYALSYSAQRKLENNFGREEEILIGAASLFSEKENHSLRLARFYYERNRFSQSLGLYRRVFILGLKKNGSEIDEEILLHLRQIYQKMNYEKDAIAITELIEVLRNKSGLSKEELKSLAISHKDNREFLVYCLYYMEHNGFEKESFEIRKLLKKRDKDRQTEEYADIFPLFIGEEGEVH